MPTATRLALEAAIARVWKAIHDAECKADVADAETIREQLSMMKQSVLELQTLMLAGNFGQMTRRTRNRQMTIDDMLPPEDQVPF